MGFSYIPVRRVSGSGGNIAIECIFYLLNGLEIKCGVDLNPLKTVRIICDYLGRSIITLKIRNSILASKN